MTLLETYLRELREIRVTGAGVEEESYYHPLAALLNQLGGKLKPKVKCVLQLANRGAGKPDGGLFTADQFKKIFNGEPVPGQIPARGAIEIKPTKDDAWVTAEARQVTRYWNRYRQVLVTNYRDFILVGQDSDGHAAILETYRLAENEKAFWAAAASPRATAEKQNDRFLEYLQRVMRHAAQIASPEDVAWFLASYARDALASIRGVELSALAAVRAALEEALGLNFEGEKGEHFFRSSLVQTLFYGIFSAWVLWSRQNPPFRSAGVTPATGSAGILPANREKSQQDTGVTKHFDWRLTAWSLRVPMISRLFSLVAEPRQLDALKLSEVLEWTGAVLNRVDRTSFFSKFEESHAVQYFYEPFLEAFDPELRKQLGVWYTPPEIVNYMVERVDAVLRQELGLPLGLADKNVYVLDPCCGTGSYLVEVLDRIHRTLKERGADGLTASDLKEAAQKRVFGFEILPAPFVVSHLQLGLLLQKLGAPLRSAAVPAARYAGQTPAIQPDRVAVYLTNALTGWEPPKGPKQHLIFPELEEERDAAEHVKREVPILVILGNPPYNAFAGVSPAEEQGLVEPYKAGLISEWGIKKFNLDDLYVRFFRLAERRITEKTGRGIVCYISNFSYLSDPSFVVMRQRFLKEFDKLWFDCMNGDSRETGKLTPEGKPDPSVFSTKHNREGIRVGTTIGLLLRVGAAREQPAEVRFRHFWGASKNGDLLRSIDGDVNSSYQPAQPDKTNRYSFRPQKVTIGYLNWPAVDSFLRFGPTLGILENRKDALISIDREPLSTRMMRYYDPSFEWETLKAEHLPLTEDMARFNAKLARMKLLTSEEFKPDAIRHLMVRPMDTRWCYYTTTRPIWNEPRPSYVGQCWPGNSAFVTRRKGIASPEGVPFCFTSAIGAQHGLNTDAYYIPLQLSSNRPEDKTATQRELLIGTTGQETTANLSSRTRAYLDELGIENVDADAETAGLIWMHALAIGYSPAYLTENADGIRQDWPRIPLPDSKELLMSSAALGRKIAALLDTETPFEVAPASRRQQEPPGWWRYIAVPARVDRKPLDESKDLALTAGWGHAGKDGVTMPGKGRVIERGYTPEEVSAFLGSAGVTGSAGVRPTMQQNSQQDAGATLLGGRTCDIYLNDVAYWKNIPVRVWEYTIGGYQVIKKWLSYREEKLLGRPMTKEEVRWVQEMAQRIAAILLLEPALDQNYRAVKAHAYKL